MKNKNYHSVRTVPKYHSVRTVPKYHSVRTVPKYHSVRTVPKLNTKNPRNRDKIDTSNTHIHDPSPLTHIYLYMIPHP